MNSNLAYSTILFDFHETLVTLNCDYGYFYSNVAKKHGANLDAKKIKLAFKQVWKNRSEYNILNDHLLPTSQRLIERWWIEYHKELIMIINKAVGEKKSEAIGKEIHTRYFSDPTLFRASDGVIEFLKRANKEEICLIILTNGDSRILNILNYFNLTVYFDELFFADKMMMQKPNKTILEKIERRLRRPLNKKQSLMVGDSPLFDVGFANNVKIDSCLYRTNSNNATYSIDSFRDLRQIVLPK